MDIKRRRRNDWPVEGNCPGNETQGNQASDNNIGWDVRAQGWQRGADTDFQAIEDEKREEDLKYGVPHADVLPNPADGNPKDGPLPNPHNFSSNPGFMSTSTMDAATSGNPANGGTARVATAGSGRTATIGPNRSGRSLRGGSSGGTGPIATPRQGTVKGTSSVGIRPRQGTTGGAAAIPKPPGSTGTLGRTGVASSGNAALPAPGDVNPGQEGGPQVVTSGYSG